MYYLFSPYSPYIYVLPHLTIFLISLPNGKSEFIIELILLLNHRRCQFLGLRPLFLQELTQSVSVRCDMMYRTVSLTHTYKHS